MTIFMNTCIEAYRTYDPTVCVTFRKTNELFGGLSNMAGGYPITVNSVTVRTAEALYQACRFPHRPDIQKMIIDQKSPMTAKMKSKPYRRDSREDWDRVRTTIMRWTLRAKLYCNRSFYNLLLSTGDKLIIEDSTKDRYWGAVSESNGTLVGKNVLGRLLMELREELLGNRIFWSAPLEPPPISKFLLYGVSIGTIECQWRDSSAVMLPEDNLQPVNLISGEGTTPMSDAIGCNSELDPIKEEAELDGMCLSSPQAEPEDSCLVLSSELDAKEVDNFKEYEDMLLRLQHLGAKKQKDAIKATVKSSPEFSLSAFRALLQKWGTDANASNRQQVAARFLKQHSKFLNQIGQLSLF